MPAGMDPAEVVQYTPIYMIKYANPQIVTSIFVEQVAQVFVCYWLQWVGPPLRGYSLPRVEGIAIFR